MTRYFIKFTDAHGDWFFMNRGIWSDRYGDAMHFCEESRARAEAKAAEDRLSTGPGYAHCRVVACRPFGSFATQKETSHV